VDIKDINLAIDQIWGKLKGALLGSPDIGKALLITSSAEPLSLPGIFDEAATQSGGDSDLETLNGLLGIAGNYLDAEKAKLKAKLFNKIKSLENGIQDLDTPQAMLYLEEEIGKLIDESKTNIERIANSEGLNVKNVAFLDGILKTNSYFGIRRSNCCILNYKKSTNSLS
jgi:hypothetical protein